MNIPLFRTAVILTRITIILACLTCLGGLLLPELYNDPPSIKAAWWANDLVTFVVVLPLLTISLASSIKGSTGARLLWMGGMLYLFYNYAFYLFGAAFNRLFLVYVALFVLSLYTLILGLSVMDVPSLSGKFSSRTPVRALSMFLCLMVLPLGIFEVVQSLQAMIANQSPSVPPLIFALDLSFVVPTGILGAVLLWRKHAWGFMLAALLLVKGVFYGLVLIVGTASVAGFRASGTWDPLLPYYVFVFAGSLSACLVLLRHLRPVKQELKKPMRTQNPQPAPVAFIP